MCWRWVSSRSISLLEGISRTLGAEELAGDVEGLAADNNNLLAVQELLGHRGRQATEEVTLAVDDNLGGEAVLVVGAEVELPGECCCFRCAQ